MRMLIVNPIAGCGYALKVMEQVQSVLTARNLPFRVMRTEYPGYAAKLAREAVEMGCEAVYVIGGDGTFSEAARGLAAASRFAPMLCRMTAKSTSWSSGSSRGGKCRTISCA